MRVNKIYIKNFRGYKKETHTSINDLTAFVGQNDAGKSTILEALDIFFNDGKNIIKMEKSDINVDSDSGETIIGVSFTGYPEEIIVDTSVPTSLKEEYLLNQNQELEIHKVYRNGTLKETLLIANYPNDEICKNLHSKKKDELQSIVEQMGLSVSDKRKSSIMRKAIFDSIKVPSLVQTPIMVDVEGTKQIWTSLKEYIPLYELFQSDRRNHDQDGEVQNPMKLLIKELMKDETISEPLKEVYEKIVVESKKLADKTIEKLSEMNPEIARELQANFEEPAWEKVFKFSLETDQGIAVNKRGSGVRRLILLNFFRAEAERRRNERNVPNVIYAFEEPETSQHPNHQKMLIDAFKELVELDINQVILTTHSPSISKMLPIEALRLIDKDGEGNTIIRDSGEDMLRDIANNLGVLPDIGLEKIKQVELAICVEGKNDINFLKNINRTIDSFKEIIDLEDDRLIIIPMGGSTLQFWVNDNYLEKLNLSQLHIYDSDRGSKDAHKYKKYIDIINTRPKSKGFETSLREFENYITHEFILTKYPDCFDKEKEDWSVFDVPELIARLTHEADAQSTRSWDEVDDKKKKDKKSKAKNRINNEFILEISKDNLVNSDCYDEIENWFKEAAFLLEGELVTL